MQTHPLIVIGLAMALVFAFNQKSDRTKPTWLQQLQGSQKIFGVIAFVLVVLIMINPELLALGLVGDTFFFDMLVLALSVQMHVMVTGIWRRGVTVAINIVRWNLIPSAG